MAAYHATIVLLQGLDELKYIMVYEFIQNANLNILIKRMVPYYIIDIPSKAVISRFDKTDPT